MHFEVDITGLEDVEKVLGNLPRVTARRIIMPALRDGAKPIKSQAEANVKSIATRGYATGTLERNIQMYNYRKYRGMYRVGVQVKRRSVNQKKIVNGEPVRIGLYASVLEYGKKNQPPQAWLRGAIRARGQEAVNAILNYFRNNLDKAVQDAKK